MSPDVCFIYVIGCDEGPVKVGISDNPWGRLRQLKTGCHLPIKLLHVQTMRDREHALYHEKWFHEVHGDQRLAGEWFSTSRWAAVESLLTAIELQADYEFEQHEAAMAAITEHGVMQ